MITITIIALLYLASWFWTIAFNQDSWCELNERWIVVLVFIFALPLCIGSLLRDWCIWAWDEL